MTYRNEVDPVEKELIKREFNSRIEDTYVEWANTLDSNGEDSTLARERLNDHETVRLLHASMGLVTEAGEIMDALKKYVFYGKPLDPDNIDEEAGDSLWYHALIAKWRNRKTFAHFLLGNKAKLTKRYGDTWNQEGALGRDTGAEMKEMSEAIQGHEVDVTAVVDAYLTNEDRLKQALEKYPDLNSIVAQISMCQYEMKVGYSSIEDNLAFVALRHYAYMQSLTVDPDDQQTRLG